MGRKGRKKGLSKEEELIRKQKPVKPASDEELEKTLADGDSAENAEDEDIEFDVNDDDNFSSN